MKQSESIGKLAAALVAAQPELRGIGRDSTNPDFRSKYASLDHIIATVRPILASHKLAIVQGSEVAPTADTVLVETKLIHESGEWLSSSVVMPLVGRMLKGGGRAAPDPQSGGSAVTYGRRYGLSAILCLSTDEDDDGTAASRPRQQARAERPAPRPTASTTASAASDKPTSIEPADAMWNGKRLGDMEDGELAALSMQMKADGKKGWVRAIAAVRGDRALGVSSAPHRTDAENVDRAMQKEAEFQSTLPG